MHSYKSEKMSNYFYVTKWWQPFLNKIVAATFYFQMFMLMSISRVKNVMYSGVVAFMLYLLSLNGQFKKKQSGGFHLQQTIDKLLPHLTWQWMELLKSHNENNFTHTSRGGALYCLNGVKKSWNIPLQMGLLSKLSKSSLRSQMALVSTNAKKADGFVIGGNINADEIISFSISVMERIEKLADGDVTGDCILQSQ